MPGHGSPLLFATLALCLATGPLAAQRRPRLPAAADTNDAVSYFNLGLERLERDPDAAAGAFYWASRLDPMSAQTWYGQYIAQLISNPSRLVKYVLRETRTMTSREVRAIDSLRLRAAALDPFFHRGLDQLLLEVYGREAIPRDQWVIGSTSLSDPELVRQLERYFAETDQFASGLLSYSRGDLADAARHWAILLARHESDFVWAERAGALVELRLLDSARANMGRAIELSRAGTPDSRHSFETRAAFRVGLARILEEERNWAGSRAGYQDAYASDPGFYPAWLRAGLLGLRTGDTATAIMALAHVLTLVPNDFVAHATLGTVFHNLGQHDSALAHLRRATEIEPWASAGWLLLGRAIDGVSDTASAVATYEHYIALAPRGEAGRLLATRRLAQLRPATPHP
jgi:tetratricopeptide (TPR) repeat protein